LFELLWLAFSPKNKIKYFISVVIVVVFCWTKYLLGDRKQTAGTVLFWSFHLSYFFSLSNDTWLENIRDQQLFTARSGKKGLLLIKNKTSISNASIIY